MLLKKMGPFRFPRLWFSFSALSAWMLCFVRHCFQSAGRTGLAGRENTLFILITLGFVLGLLLPALVPRQGKKGVLLFRLLALFALPCTALAVHTAGAAALAFTFLAAMAVSCAVGLCLPLLAAGIPRGEMGAFMGTTFAASEAALVLLFFLPFFTPPAPVITAAPCLLLTAAAVLFRPECQPGQSGDAPEPAVRPPARGVLVKYLLALLLCCVMDGMLDNLYAFDNAFQGIPNLLLFLYLYSIVLNLLMGFLFSGMNWRRVFVSTVLIICAGQSLAFFSSITALAVPYLALTTMGVVAMEFLVRVVPVWYAKELTHAGTISRLGYSALYLGFCATSVLFEWIPRSRYFFVLGIVLVLAFLTISLLHSASGEEEKEQRERLMKELQALSEEKPASGAADSLLEDFFVRLKSLTPTEREVFFHMAAGKSNGEIAAAMFISMSTLKKHNTHIFIKLNVASRDDLALYILLAQRSGRLEHIVIPSYSQISAK